VKIQFNSTLKEVVVKIDLFRCIRIETSTTIVPYFCGNMISIGKIKSLHGIKGQVLFVHHLQHPFDEEQLDAVLIEIWENSFIPYFIEEINAISDTEMILTIEGIQDRNIAMQLLNKKVYAPNVATSINLENNWLSLMTYQVLDEEQQLIGEIKDVYINGKQTLLEVLYQNKLVLLPISDELLIQVDRTNKTVQLRLAEGILDL